MTLSKQISQVRDALNKRGTDKASKALVEIDKQLNGSCENAN